MRTSNELGKQRTLRRKVGTEHCPSSYLLISIDFSVSLSELLEV